MSYCIQNERSREQPIELYLEQQGPDVYLCARGVSGLGWNVLRFSHSGRVYSCPSIPSNEGLPVDSDGHIQIIN